MEIAENTGHDIVHVQLRFFGETVEAMPGMAAKLLPEKPTPERILLQTIFGDSVALNFAFNQAQRTAGTFRIHAHIGEIALTIDGTVMTR